MSDVPAAGPALRGRRRLAALGISPGTGRTDLLPYLGCSSVALDHLHAEGHMRLRSDMRGPTGLLVAPLGIALLDTA
jgi:hypothetical protein